MQLLIVIAGLSQRVDRIRTGCGGKNNSEGAVSMQEPRLSICEKFQRHRRERERPFKGPKGDFENESH